MAIPNTSNDLVAMGYSFDNEATCRGCGQKIEWWITPAGKKMPMTVISRRTIHSDPGDLREPHWGHCPNADQFRKR